MTLNYIPVLVFTFISFILGFVWYSVLFKNIFMKNIGKTPEELREGSTPFIFVYELLSTFITLFALSALVSLLQLESFVSGFQIGLLISLAFVLMPQLSTVTFEKRNFILYLLGTSYRTIVISIAAGVFAIWK